MSEMGWEVGDIVVMGMYKYCFKDKILNKVPASMFVGMFIHHSLATLLGLPMIIHYRHLRALHWLIFDLQAIGAVVPLTEYGKLLDIKNPNELRQFKVVNFIWLIAVFWTRFIHWIYCAASIVLTWYSEKNWVLIACGLIPIGLFTKMNLGIVLPAYKRFMKVRVLIRESNMHAFRYFFLIT